MDPDNLQHDEPNVNPFDAILATMVADYCSTLPRDAEGRYLCPDCGGVMTPGAAGRPYCPPCADAERERDRREQIATSIEWATAHWMRQLPRWGYARLGNEAWTRRVDSRLLAAVRQWNPLDAATGVFFVGPTGRGKSSAIAAKLHAVADAEAARIRDGAKARRLPKLAWTTEAELVRARRGQRLGTGEAKAVERAMDADVLVLDEVGYSGGEKLLMEVVDYRYAKGRATSLTSGLRAGEFRANYGEALFRRLAERATSVDAHRAVAQA